MGAIATWIARRKAIRARWQADAIALISRDERNAFYDAQRLAARSRAAGDKSEFLHWAKVAAEVARRSSFAEMDIAKVQHIVDQELERRR